MTKENSALLIIVGVLVLIVGGVFLFGIRPLLGRYSALQQERAATEKEYQELSARVRTLEQLSKDAHKIEELSGRARTYLPTTVASSPFLMDIAAIGGQSQTTIISVTFQTAEPQKGSAIAEHPITISAEGTFENLQTLLRFLEENLRFTTLSTVSFSVSEAGHALQATGSIFSKPEDKNPKDKSLVLDEAMKSLLEARKVFGQPVDPKGPGRPDPFVAF